MDDSTERFLYLLNKQNVAIAAAQEKQKDALTSDPIRVQREAERRERWGQLRAREQPSKRPHRITNVFPHVDLSRDD